MIATVTHVTFIDRTADKRHEYGDVISISRKDFTRINAGRNKPLLTEGKINLGMGTCYPCKRKTT